MWKDYQNALSILVMETRNMGELPKYAIHSGDGGAKLGRITKKRLPFSVLETQK